MRATPVRAERRAQRGFALLEVLVSIVVFALGVITVMQLQSALAKDELEAKFRSSASLSVSDLIGRMYASQRSPDALNEEFGTGRPGFQAWVESARLMLPTLDADNTGVTVTPVAAGGAAASTSHVRIELAWKARGDASGRTVHRVTSVTQIGG